jgi:hypothetical protein
MTKPSSTKPIMTGEELTAMMMAIITEHCREIPPKLAFAASHNMTPHECWQAACQKGRVAPKRSRGPKKH